MKLLKIKLCITLAFSGLAADQSTVLKGKIIDSKTKEPLIGANVIVVGTGQGSASNMKGEFFIKDISEELVDIKVGYIGYVSRTLQKTLSSDLKRDDLK